MYLVLDHLEKPYLFLNSLIQEGISSIIILVEKVEGNKGLPIQHLTGWSEESLIYLSKILNMNIEIPNLNSKDYISAILSKE